MKIPYIKLLNQIGIFVLYLLISLVPFHFNLTEYPSLLLYRELIAIIFILLILINLYEGKLIDFKMRSELFFLILFPVLLFFAAFYDPMINLYTDYWGWVSKTFQAADPRVYIIRNAVLYLPMILYFAIRGLSQEEIKNIAIICIFIAPFSILFYLLSVYDDGNFSIFLLSDMAEVGGANIQYNSYVPYLTFPFISGIYLLSTRNSFWIKCLSFGSISIMSIFMFLSSSRQSMLLLLFALLVFALFDKTGKGRKLILYAVGFSSVFFFFYLITVDVTVNENLIDKYNSGAETSRFNIFIEGLGLLRIHEFFTGAGLSSVVNSGPHNDYLRWTQRVGLIFMIVSFLPFFISLKGAVYKVLIEKEKVHFIYIALSIFFTIYHSLFGYPREDAFQALFCFLGLGIWLGFSKNQNKKMGIV